MSRSKSFTIGFFLAGTVSAATALLLTPASGKDLRNKVVDQGAELKKIAEDLIQDALKLKDQIAKTSKEGAVLISELTEEMKTSIEDWKEAVEPHQDNIYDYLEQIESSIKELEDKLQQEKKDNKE